jgi:hypothetical protein
VGKIYQLCSCAVAVFAVTVTIRCDWMRRTKTMGSHFNVTACRVRAVSFSLIRNPLYSGDAQETYLEVGNILNISFYKLWKLCSFSGEKVTQMCAAKRTVLI